MSAIAGLDLDYSGANTAGGDDGKDSNGANDASDNNAMQMTMLTIITTTNVKVQQNWAC